MAGREGGPLLRDSLSVAAVDDDVGAADLDDALHHQLEAHADCHTVRVLGHNFGCMAAADDPDVLATGEDKLEAAALHGQDEELAAGDGHPLAPPMHLNDNRNHGVELNITVAVSDADLRVIFLTASTLVSVQCGEAMPSTTHLFPPYSSFTKTARSSKSPKYRS